MTSMLKPSLRLHTSNANLDLNTSSPSRLPFDPQSIASTTANFVPMHPSSTTTPTLASPTSIRSTHTDTGSINTMDNNHTNTAGAMALHTGAIDKTTITTRPPTEVMTKARDVLDSIGICVQPEGVFRLRCVRPPQSSSGSETTPGGPEPSISETSTNTIYANDPSRDPAGEVRFSVELTRLAGLNDTYSLDIRRLKGNLRSYQFLYETIRDRVQLTS